MERSERQAPGGGGGKGKGPQWQMTRPKDIIPNVFDGKEDDWPGWKAPHGWEPAPRETVADTGVGWHIRLFFSEARVVRGGGGESFHIH